MNDGGGLETGGPRVMAGSPALAGGFPIGRLQLESAVCLKARSKNHWQGRPRFLGLPKGPPPCAAGSAIPMALLTTPRLIALPVTCSCKCHRPWRSLSHAWELSTDHAMIRVCSSKPRCRAVARFGQPGSVWRSTGLLGSVSLTIR